MQQSQSSSSYMYPSSPTPNVPLYDSGYSSFGYSTPSPTSFHFSTCPYSNDSFYMPSQQCKLIFENENNYSNILSFVDPSYYSPIPYSMHQPSQSFISSTPLPSSNVCLAPSTQVSFTLFSISNS